MEKPKTGPGDIAHIVVKAGLSAIPIVGGPAAELFSTVIVPPLSRRRDEWVESIAEGLKVLEEKVGGFKVESLSRNEMFITTVMHASQSAIRNHQKEKMEALRNAVLNAALPNAPDDDLQLMFLDFVDTFTTWHLRILRFYNDPERWGGEKGYAYSVLSLKSSPCFLEEIFPDLKGRHSFYEQIIKDLVAHGLIGSEVLAATQFKIDFANAGITDLGNKLIRFITSPLQ